MVKIVSLSSALIIQTFAQEFTSPIHSTNQYINQIILYRPYTQSAMIKKSDSVNIDISQSNVFQTSDNLEADFEFTTLDLTYYKSISHSMELTFNYPLYYLSKGFLDNPLDFIHTTLRIETTRENDGHINNQLKYQVSDQIYKEHAYFSSGNPQIEIKYALYKSDDLFISTNAGVKIPLGDESDGFTSGKIDIMSGIQFQKNYERVSWIANLALTLNGKKELSSDIASEQLRYFIYLANKFPLTYILPFDYFTKTDFLFAYQYSSAPYDGSDEKFSSHTHLLQFAIRSYIDNESYLDIFFNQNTIPRHNEADVTFGLSYHFKGVGA